MKSSTRIAILKTIDEEIPQKSVQQDPEKKLMAYLRERREYI